MIEVWQSACTEMGSILKSEMKRNKVWRLAICCSSHLHFITGQPIDSNWSQKLGFSGKEKQEKCGYWFCTVHGAWLIVCFRETHFPISTQIWNVTLSFSMLCYVFQKEFKLYQLTFGKEVERVCSKGNLHFLFTPSPIVVLPLAWMQPGIWKQLHQIKPRKSKMSWFWEFRVSHSPYSKIEGK